MFSIPFSKQHTWAIMAVNCWGRALVEPQAPKEGPQVIDKRPWCLVNPIDIAYVCELLFLFLLKSYRTTVPWIRLVPLHVHPLRDFDWMQQRYICLTGSQTCNSNRCIPSIATMLPWLTCSEQIPASPPAWADGLYWRGFLGGSGFITITRSSW